MKDGKEVQVEKTENVQQSYAVEVPYMIHERMIIDLPAPGVLAEDAVVDGLLPPFTPNRSFHLRNKSRN